MGEDSACYCTFCGKTHHEVEVMINGDAANICNECVAVCVGVVAEYRATHPPIRQAAEAGEK